MGHKTYCGLRVCSRVHTGCLEVTVFGVVVVGIRAGPFGYLRLPRFVGVHRLAGFCFVCWVGCVVDCLWFNVGFLGVEVLFLRGLGVGLCLVSGFDGAEGFCVSWWYVWGGFVYFLLGRVCWAVVFVFWFT